MENEKINYFNNDSILTQMSKLNQEEISWLRDFIEGYSAVLLKEYNIQKTLYQQFKDLSISTASLNEYHEKLINIENILKSNEDRVILVLSVVNKLKAFDGIIEPSGELNSIKNESIN